MADKDKVEQTTAVHIPSAKYHSVLSDINEQLQGLLIAEVVEVAGHKYELSMLTADEEVWSDTFSNASSQISVWTSIRVPRLAAAIKSIDGIPASQLFQFGDNVPEADKKYHTETPTRRHYWEMHQMLLWLADQPNALIVDLWKHYTKLAERRDTTWAELKKASARIPGGDSKDTSSPANPS